SLKTSIKTITYLSDIGCLEIQGASLLGINDLFITIPRQGLKVNSDITIIATDSETKGRKKQIVRQTIAALTTVFSVTLGSLMYLHIH
ncbi:hypothetical protein NPZ81_03245, partial [Salmonella enterica]|nr:hypothetical protein [Salmonella enterica]MCQ7222363.1 hypothetical protein [Salmonella enterica]MCQ7349583.1 hypothetical protein [Salmonella enterica]MCQ7587516.1 hypothetical protein [Salmonella enterica]MCQ7597335.1 hypothetical protein [Salmonella enterica]